jgi:hypothetical protein
MSNRNQIRSFWKPDGKTVHSENQRRLKAWLSHHALSTHPGALTILLHSPVHESARKHLARAIESPESPAKDGR